MKISCIVCAYNEEKRIGNVLRILVESFFDEIIVVDDGSTDNTAGVVKSFPNVLLISHDKNKGKSMAMVSGIEAAKNELLVFIDADLVGLTVKNLQDLVYPVLNNKVDVSISLRKNSLLIYKIFGLDFVSGERVVKKSVLLPFLEQIKKLSGFGVEVFMNEVIIKNKYSLGVIYWQNVLALRKSSKVGFLKGFLGDFKMILQILKTVSILKIIAQNYKMFFLVKYRS